MQYYPVVFFASRLWLFEDVMFWQLTVSFQFNFKIIWLILTSSFIRALDTVAGSETEYDIETECDIHKCMEYVVRPEIV
jgi:hypothetical protein